MKAIVIAGRLTKDAQFRTTQNGDKITSFSVAVDDGYGQNKGSLFFDCSLWGKRGDNLSPLLTKGKPVTVSGELGIREYEGKTYLTIRVNDLDLQGGKPQDSGGSSGGYYGGYGAPAQGGGSGRGGYDQTRNGAPAGGGRSDFDDDLPFAPCWQV